MITPKINGTKVIFGPCRLSYTHLFQPYSPEGGEKGKYQTNVLIPKSEKETVKAINKAIEEAKNQFVQNKCKGVVPKRFDLPLRDGDDKESESDVEVYENNYYLNAKCKTRPGIVDKEGNPITDEEDIYSGVWAIVSVTFYGYDVSGNKGIACGLNNVMKVKDGERLGGRTSAANDFSGISFDSEDDEDL